MVIMSTGIAQYDAPSRGVSSAQRLGQPVPIQSPLGEAPVLLTPSPHGFVQLASNIALPRLPFLSKLLGAGNSPLTEIKALAQGLQGQNGVEKVTVYRKAFSPAGGAPFNVAVLLETDTVDSANRLMGNQGFQPLANALTYNGQKPQVFVASNARRMGNVDRDRPGLFIFNYFTSEKPKEKVIRVWEKEAKAYQDDAGLNNSLLLAPEAGTSSRFALMNHARWNAGGLPHMIWVHLTKRRLQQVKNDEAINGVTSQPTVYRLA